MSYTLKILAALILVGMAQNLAYALNMDCADGKALGKAYRGSRTELPDIKHRQILGVWQNVDFKGINVSIEVANGTVYYVFRDRYCGSGKFGEALRKKGVRFYRLDNPAGDYYEILSDGSLGRFDKQGLIDRLPASERLHPL